jgi:phosphatidylinositol-3-phosphatase
MNSRFFLPVLSMVVSVALSLQAQTTPVPRPDHVVIVIEENHRAPQIIGNAAAPYINSLADQGALFTKSFAAAHPSQPNYLHLFSGSNQGCTSDSVPPAGAPYTTANLGAELLAKGLTFGGYSQTQPSVGFLGGSSSKYVRKHNPWCNWQGTGTNQLPPELNMPFSSFPADYSTLPTISIVVPDLQYDMHSGTITAGDTWLKNNLDGYIQWAKTHNSLFILTFDEDDFTTVNQIPTIFVGPMVKQGQYSEPITHHIVLRTLEDMYGLDHAGAAGDTTPIIEVWMPFQPQSLICSITAPVTGVVVSGLVTVTASASSSVGISRVDFLVDSLPLASDDSAPYSAPWDSKMATDGPHTLQAKAIDLKGATESSSIITVTVKNEVTLPPPAVSITVPPDRAKPEIVALH